MKCSLTTHKERMAKPHLPFDCSDEVGAQAGGSVTVGPGVRAMTGTPRAAGGTVGSAWGAAGAHVARVVGCGHGVVAGVWWGTSGVGTGWCVAGTLT